MNPLQIPVMNLGKIKDNLIYSIAINQTEEAFWNVVKNDDLFHEYVTELNLIFNSLIRSISSLKLKEFP